MDTILNWLGVALFAAIFASMVYFACWIFDVEQINTITVVMFSLTGLLRIHHLNS